MRPAWRGIAGWLLLLAAFVIGITAPWPQNGLTLLAVALAAAGALLVAAQINRTARRTPQ